MTYAGEADAPEGYDGDWGTPSGLVAPVAEALGGFDLDPAGRTPTEIAEEGEGAEQYADEVWDVRPSTPDGMSDAWHGDVWLNPPYGRKENPRWGRRVSRAVSQDECDSITALIPASTTADWFHDHYLDGADVVCLLDTRLKFVAGGSYAKARFGNALVHFGCGDPPGRAIVDGMRDGMAAVDGGDGGAVLEVLR